MMTKSNMHVLIVEDNPSNAKLLKAQLEAEGLTTTHARNGLEAISLLQKNHVDVIISDILMPKMDGYKLCHEVKKTKKWANIPFIFYTATYTSPSDEKLALELGANAFLRKPASTKEIVDVMKQAAYKPQQKTRRVNPFKEKDVLREYSDRLVAKLEQKNIELAQRTKELGASEAAMKIAHDQLKNIFDSLDEVFFSFDPVNNKLLRVSPACEPLYGYPQEAFIKNPLLWFEVIHPEDKPRIDAENAQLSQGVPKQWECRIVGKGGEIRWIDTKAKPTFDESGKVIRIDAIVTDITQRKHMEEQVRQAAKLESIGTLAGGMAHDFNNILGIIVAYGSLIQRGKLSSEDLREYTNTMMKAAERGSGLVKQILTFARKSDVAITSVKVNYVIKELISMLHQMFPKTIGFSVDLDKSLPIISIDSGQLHQALMNLCVNARDAILEANRSGKMQSTISIRTTTISGDELRKRHATALPGEYVSISVSDTGTGMDEKTKQRIFEPFFTTKEQGKGTGLGLAVVYGVVESHKGFVELDTQLGKGTTFTMYFRMPEDASMEKESGKNELVDTSGGSETVFVVEDEEALRMLLKNLLQAKGYTVVAASDGVEAVQTFETKKDEIDIVISDHGLPGMNGADVVKRMMASKRGLKCIIASGYVDPKDKSQIFKSGVKEFIQKPYDPLEVVRKLREVLDLE